MQIQLRSEALATLLQRAGQGYVNQALQVETRGREPIMLEAILGFLQVPKVGSLVGGSKALRAESWKRFIANADLGFPNADGFIPICTGQTFAVGTEYNPWIERRVPVALRSASQREHFVSRFDI